MNSSQALTMLLSSGKIPVIFSGDFIDKWNNTWHKFNIALHECTVQTIAVGDTLWSFQSRGQRRRATLRMVRDAKWTRYIQNFTGAK